MDFRLRGNDMGARSIGPADSVVRGPDLCEPLPGGVDRLGGLCVTVNVQAVAKAEALIGAGLHRPGERQRRPHPPVVADVKVRGKVGIVGMIEECNAFNSALGNGSKDQGSKSTLLLTSSPIPPGLAVG